MSEHRQRRLPLFYVALPILAVVIALFGSAAVKAPDYSSSSVFSEGAEVSLRGEFICLEHRDTSGPVTLECALGFRDEHSRSFGIELADTTNFPEFGRQVDISGTYRTSTDAKYKQNGSIKLSEIKPRD